MIQVYAKFAGDPQPQGHCLAQQSRSGTSMTGTSWLSSILWGFLVFFSFSSWSYLAIYSTTVSVYSTARAQCSLPAQCTVQQCTCSAYRTAVNWLLHSRALYLLTLRPKYSSVQDSSVADYCAVKLCTCSVRSKEVHLLSLLYSSVPDWCTVQQCTCSVRSTPVYLICVHYSSVPAHHCQVW